MQIGPRIVQVHECTHADERAGLVPRQINAYSSQGQGFWVCAWNRQLRAVGSCPASIDTVATHQVTSWQYLLDLEPRVHS